MEHIVEDEIEAHLALIEKKVNKDGYIITITPNRYRGPSDITAKFESRGTVARGFHFYEYTYSEIVALFRKYGMTSCLGVWLGFIGYFRHKYIVFSVSRFIDSIKVTGECFI
jgi:hypothetical protein